MAEAAERAAAAALALAAALLAGCAADPSAEPARRPSVRAGEFGTPDCFLRRAAADFKVLDERNLVVFAPGRDDAYHVQVSLPLQGLRFADTVAFESRNTRICGYAGDELLLRRGGGGPERASVVGVYRLDRPALEGLLARFGAGAAPAQPAPRPGAGADIETEPGEAGEPAAP